MNKYSMYRHNKTLGFTLMELLISIGIIAILVVIGVVSYGSLNKRSRDAKRKSDIEQIRSALELYKADNGHYPAPQGATFNNSSWYPVSGLTALTLGSYISSLPTDPQDDTNKPYQIIMTNEVDSEYYGYCLSAYLESLTTPSSNCSVALPNDLTGESYTYGSKNP